MDSHVVSGPNDAAVVSMADAMQANGSTNLNAGLTVGYSLAQKNFVPAYLNRVVLISDGQANTGVTDENIIAQGASLNDGDGVYLVGVGVGDGVNDTLMDTVTDKGRGAYVYLDTLTEATRMFVTRFDETMDVAARAVQVKLDLPWYLGVARFYGEQISTNAKAVEPQHLAPNDAMVFDQVLRPCAAEQFNAEDAVNVTANWLTPTTHEPRSSSASATLGALMSSAASHLPKGMAIVAYAEALKAGSTAAAVAHARAKVAAAQVLGADAELQEIDSLLQKLEAKAQ
jgi:Ca-activated chloride channel family protein